MMLNLLLLGARTDLKTQVTAKKKKKRGTKQGVSVEWKQVCLVHRDGNGVEK